MSGMSPPADRPLNDAGFTLIELLVVMTIMGLVSGLAAAMMPIHDTGVALARQQLDLKRWLQQQVDHASRDQLTITLVQQGSGLASSDGSSWNANAGVGARLRSQDRQGLVRLYADGSATAATAELVAGDDVRTIRLSPLTAAVVIEP